jgi:Flp pilus assembly protein TadG
MLYRTDRDAVDVFPALPGLRSSARGRRKGAQMVEFAVVAPILFLMLMGMFEIGRGLMVTELLTAGARAGARVGMIPGKSSTDVSTAAVTYMSTVGITGDSATVYVNDVAVSGSGTDPLTNAPSGSEVTVKLTVPVNKITWMPPGIFLGAASTLSLKGQFTLRRE